MAAARRFADQIQGNLIVITVVRPLYALYGDVGMGPVSGSYVNFESEAMAHARKSAELLAAKYDVPKENVRVERGSPAAEIQNVATELDAEMIVIGTHGRHGLGLVLGSTANAVLHGVPCDVLAVRVHPASAAAA